MAVTATGYAAAQPELDAATATGATRAQRRHRCRPRVIPLGTRLFVPGYGYAIAADTGGAIEGAHIDLCFDTVPRPCWGRRPSPSASSD